MKKIILFLALMSFLAFSAKSQFINLKNGCTPCAGIFADTVTNTATGFVQADASNSNGNVTSVAWTATKISGVVAGTVALHGSNDGVNYYSISTTTFTATDITTQGGIWLLTGSPMRFYRVTWTGTGTMSATLKGTAYTNRQ